MGIFQKIGQFAHQSIAFGRACLAFPYCQHSPAQPAKLPLHACIAAPVPFTLRLPVFRVCLRRLLPRLAVVHVPKAAVDEYGDAVPRQHHVRAAGQVAAVQAEAIAEPVHEPAHDAFGRRVLRFHAPHGFASCLGREVVHQAVALGVRSFRRRLGLIESNTGVRMFWSIHSTAGTQTASPKPYIA